jgi:hypothetical protein
MDRENERINTAQDDENSWDRLLTDAEVRDIVALDLPRKEESLCKHLYNAPGAQFFHYCNLIAEVLVEEKASGLEFTTKFEEEKSVEVYTHQTNRRLIVNCTEPLRRDSCPLYKIFS